ncbi:MAG: RloB family protein [Rhodothermaceae bacterium]
MGRERKNFNRSGFKRKVHSLFIIATEGEKTEKQYLNALQCCEQFNDKKIFIETIVTKKGNSSPRSVISRLDVFKKEYSIAEDDELWLVIDRDKQSWEADEISQVAQSCCQKKYFLAISNPCFELWLLLHKKKLSDYSENEQISLFENKRVNKTRTKLEQELKDVFGSYNKANLRTQDYIPYVNTAIQNSSALDDKPNERWPSNLGTHFYKLAKKLLKSN